MAKKPVYKIKDISIVPIATGGFIIIGTVINDPRRPGQIERRVITSYIGSFETLNSKYEVVK